MINFFVWVVAMAMCPAVEVKNVTEEPWDDRDTKELNVAIENRTCERLYPTTSPCLATFIKVGHLHYKAWCGPKRDNDGN